MACSLEGHQLNSSRDLMWWSGLYKRPFLHCGEAVVVGDFAFLIAKVELTAFSTSSHSSLMLDPEEPWTERECEDLFASLFPTGSPARCPGRDVSSEWSRPAVSAIANWLQLAALYPYDQPKGNLAISRTRKLPCKVPPVLRCARFSVYSQLPLRHRRRCCSLQLR